jgi:hypothetical protein
MSSYDDERRTVIRDAPPGRDDQSPGPLAPTDPRSGEPAGYVQPPAGYGQPGGYGVQQPFGYSMRQQWAMRPRRVYPIETKPFFLTSEFAGALLAIFGIAITAASSDSFGAWRAWVLISGIVAAYLLSRGIAKAGTRSHSDDPRDRLDLGRGHGAHTHDGGTS